MSAKGARYKWKEGNIYHASRYWKSPTMRRPPRILIEDRAMEVGILVYVDEPWIIFSETSQKSTEISLKNAQQLELYKNRYYLLPAEFEGINTYQWMKDKKNAFLLWGFDNKYYVRAEKRP